MNKAVIEHNATVVEKISDTRFHIKLAANEKLIPAYISGKMSQRYIRVYPGDKVKVELPTFSMDNARIVYRYKN